MMTAGRAAARQHQSIMTDEEAIAWAEAIYEQKRRWTTMRFRVDTDTMSNSRFVSRELAERLQARYGGTIRELIPTRTEYLASKGITPRSVRYLEETKGMGSCPRCSAKADEPCKMPGGSPRAPHDARVKDTNFHELAAELKACPKCGAEVGSACFLPNGQHRPPHKVRQ